MDDGYSLKDDKKLLEAYSKGDNKAFETFYLRHRDGLYRFLIFISKEENVSVDIMQKTFLKLIEKNKDFLWRETVHPKRWLYRVAINFWKDELRKNRRKKEEDIQDIEDIQDNRYIEKDDTLINAVRESVSNLHLKYRLVVSLRYFGGLSIEEISRVLKIPQGTVKSRLNKAMLVLFDSLKKYKDIINF